MKPEKLEQIKQAMAGGATLRGAAKAAGVHASTAMRALRKSPAKVRKAVEFSGTSKATAPLRAQPIGSWSLETIRQARDDQMRGQFKQPVRLAEAMRTDDALFVAYHNRLAPHNAIASELQPSDDSDRARAVARRAGAGVFLTRTTLEGAVGTLANHGLAILQIRQEPNEDGTKVDFHVEEWPLEHVSWNPHKECLETSTRWAPRVPIIHGDGEWVVIRKFEVLPWTQEACLLPAAMLWAGHAFGLSDWAQSTKSHGQAKMAAQLNEGVALEEKDDSGAIALTPEARATLQTLQDMVSGEAGAGIFPNGTKVDFLANGSTAWQVFSEFVQNREKGAARIYNGTDATMGSAGGAPGVDISVLFGVASTKVQGDLGAVMAAVNSGVYVPWTAINVGSSRYAPKLAYLIPDPDAARESQENSAREQALAATIKAYRDAGVAVDQPLLDRLAKAHGISVPPRVGTAPAEAPGGRVRASRLALAGNFDESKIRRAKDGRFGDKPGAGGGSPGGSEGDGPKDRGGEESEGPEDDDEAKQPKDRKAVAEERLAQAREQHAKAAADLSKAEEGLKQAKAEAHAEVDKTEAARAHAAKEATKYAGEAKARREALEAEADKLEAESGVDPDDADHPVNDRIGELRSEAEDLASTEAALRAEAKRNARPDKQTARLRAAIEAEDFGTIEHAEARQIGVENDAAAEWAARHHIWKAKGFEGEPSPAEVERMAGAYQRKQPKEGQIRVTPDFFLEPGQKVGRFVDEESTFGARSAAREKAAGKAARAARAVRAHEREVRRVGGKVDADGDGRTGAAEERDDKPVKASRFALAGNFDESKIRRAKDGKFGDKPGAGSNAGRPEADEDEEDSGGEDAEDDEPAGSFAAAQADVAKRFSSFEAANEAQRAEAAREISQQAPRLKELAKAEKRARSAHETDLRAAGYSSTPPELDGLTTARESLAIAEQNSGGRGQDAFTAEQVSARRAKLAAAEEAARPVFAKMPEGAAGRYAELARIESEAIDTADHITFYKRQARNAELRGRGAVELRAALRAGDAKGARRAQARIDKANEDGEDDDLDALGSLGLDTRSYFRARDADGDGRTGQAEERDDKEPTTSA